MTDKFIVWIKEKGKWVEQGDGLLTKKQADRIASEIRKDFHIPVMVLPSDSAAPGVMNNVDKVVDRILGEEGEAEEPKFKPIDRPAAAAALKRKFDQINNDCEKSGENVVPLDDVEYYASQIEIIWGVPPDRATRMATEMAALVTPEEVARDKERQAKAEREYKPN